MPASRRLRKEDAETQTRFFTWLEEMKLVASVFLARFIVWRELRREHRESGGLKR